ncbi:Fimbrin-like protein 2 [Acorus calamus]|uniref:Fimbrin-like protein 2 n=1 Tax=Acorus calamus TaxID=4465 RepID=A0AAV9CRX5_ACOCL|nr:Fimbrin-like protein 2 [Acorus calamus]
MEVNQKMILTLTASIMYWSLQQPVESEPPLKAAALEEEQQPSPESENGSTTDGVSNLNLDDPVSNTPQVEIVEADTPPVVANADGVENGHISPGE